MMISIVIPALDEEKALPGTLAAVASAQRHLAAHDPSWAIECIVVDGGSRDRTVEIACSTHGTLVVGAERGRARQMNAGARRARGEWLLFLHADTLLPPRGVTDIASLGAHVHAGCFHQAFSGTDWRLRLVSRIHNYRWSRTGIMYGDQGMFVRRSLFERIGGFPDVDMLEDVAVSESIVALTWPIMLDAAVTTDSRKFEQRGIVRSFARCLAIVLCYRAGLPIPSRSFFEPVR